MAEIDVTLEQGAVVNVTAAAGAGIRVDLESGSPEIRVEVGCPGPEPAAVPSAWNSEPMALGTPSSGLSDRYARGDHVHGMPTAPDVGAMPEKGILYYAARTVNTATNAQILRIPASGTDAAITADTVVLECVFADPGVLERDVTWTSYAGYVAFTGTCRTATTADVVLGRKGN